jgi:hypothetical protein
MKTQNLLTLVAFLALATTAMADNSIYNSKANTGKVLAPRTTSVVLTANDFDGSRLSSKVQTIAPAGPITKTDRAVACSKPMDKAACKAHCGT